MSEAESRDAALVGEEIPRRGQQGIVARVERRASRQQRTGKGEASPVGQGRKQRVERCRGPDEVA